MSTITTLSRTDQVVAKQLARAPRPVTVKTAGMPRRPWFRSRREHVSTAPAPRVMDLHIRSVAMWPRAYR
jgi:hypothetical protein